jgi:Pentapeptide repeats (8 copies)
MSRQVPGRRVLIWFGLLVAAAVVVVAGIYIVFWPLSDLIASHDVGAITGPRRAAALMTARDAARGRLLAFGAGLFAAGALVYTGRNFTLSRRTFELTEQGQVTDRYTKAIEQLGSDQLDVRIGGIYALERVARDSARDHFTVMEVLAAFVVERSREQRPPSADAYGTRSDVQAAIRVIGHRTGRYDRRKLRLQHANLNDADLVFLNLAAKLTDADLARANLYRANLSGADLTRANLTGADLTEAKLTRDDFGPTDLTGADLTGAILTDAVITGVVGLDQAELAGAVWPSHAWVPTGWQRDTSGRLSRAGL